VSLDHSGRFGGNGKELNRWARAARRAGWTVARTGRDHWRWTDPTGRLVLTTGGTPNGIGLHRAIAKLRREGL
jgi:hypothetical protein